MAKIMEAVRLALKEFNKLCVILICLINSPFQTEISLEGTHSNLF